MNRDLQDRADQFQDGLITASEFIQACVLILMSKWQELEQTNDNSDPEVLALADTLFHANVK